MKKTTMRGICMSLVAGMLAVSMPVIHAQENRTVEVDWNKTYQVIGLYKRLAACKGEREASVAFGAV